ncbi:serine hydrolase domain-containing protein [Sphingomicrobium aestuariivivum]|uniref:serine hydrolase domain-containing protein n=1 Tax=Sphingomicrobium aestuariivivum TaxID=1582356 RepID=UPI001FD6C349|nr:serine hydrolase domain-containing protein [Sphingomicrobium aestuariivivum]MCJ8190692.1 beta-lactamase family protein [Sphingomicrobium aestuariivivum]
MRIVAVSLMLAGVASPATAQPLTGGERTAIEELLEALETDGAPGVAVGIVRGGERVFEDYRGLADLSAGTAIGPETRFNIASNAKQYVALMVLGLAAEGRVGLDADFRTYLPSALPEVGETITVRQLLHHRSGVRDVYDLWALTGVTWYERALDNDDAMALLKRQRGLNFAPGSEHGYSNSNCVLLAELVAAVTGVPFESHAASVFEGLGMDETGWRARYGDVVVDGARAYNKWDGWLENPSIANLMGDGFLYSTLDDQLAYEARVQGGEDALVAAAQAPGPDGGYGYGLEHDAWRGLERAWHVGSTGGFNAYGLRYPEEALSVVVLGNNAQIGVVALGNAIAEALIGAREEAAPTYAAGPGEVLARPANAAVVGAYEQEGGSIIAIVERDGALYRELEGREPVELRHEAGNVFAYATLADLKIAFEGERFRLFLPSQPVATFDRLAPVPTDAATLESIEGRYVNGETDTEIVIEHAGGAAYRMVKNGRTRDAVMVAKDDLRWAGYRLRFERGADGAVERLLVDNGRNRGVKFEPAAQP